MSDGEYLVMFDTHNGIPPREVGRFLIEYGSIVLTRGPLVVSLLPHGKITPMTEMRIKNSLNNGYYHTVKSKE